MQEVYLVGDNTDKGENWLLFKPDFEYRSSVYLVGDNTNKGKD